MNVTHHELLARVASMYYLDEQSQDAIGKALGLSRVKVYRLLKEAREAGVVRIAIDWPIPRNTELEQALRQTFGLRDALVLKTNGSASNLRDLGQLGAHCLDSVLADGSTLAVCLGQSTHAVVSAMRPRTQSRVRVAQAVGSIPFTMQAFDSATIGRELAAKLGGEVLYLSSPMMADNAEAATVIRRQQQVQATLEAARKADVALVGIGAMDAQQSRLVDAGFMPPEGVARLIEQGAVGDMAGQIFDMNGQPLATTNERMIGITLDELARVPVSLAVAAGVHKTQAIIGGLRSRACNVLCTDDVTALAVLNAAP